jgi:hypothetical protein
MLECDSTLINQSYETEVVIIILHSISQGNIKINYVNICYISSFYQVINIPADGV